jgi:recombinational DNA repair ATPase RecF
MKIRRLQLRDWRGVSASDVAFGDGVTIVAGANEVGKSSLIEALRCLFRYPDDSNHRDIKAVRPLAADAAPEVRLEAELGAARLVYSKRYRKPGRAGETMLRFTPPDGGEIHLTGRDAHDRAEKLLGEHLDVDLWQALQVEQGRAIAQATLADKRGLQEALDAAAGNDTGLGAEDAVLVERARAEYERYFTPGGKPRGDWAQLPEALRQATERRDALRARIGDVQASVERHAMLSAQRQAKAKRLPGLEAEADAAERHWEQVKALKSAWEQGSLSVDKIALGLANLRQQRERRLEWTRELASRRKSAEDAEGQLRACAAQRQADEARLRDLTAQRAGIEARRTRAAARQRSVQAALDRVQQRAERDRLDGVLAQLDALDRDLVAARALADATVLDAGDVERLRDLHQAAIRAEAAAEAVSPAVRIEALRDVDLVVRGEPVHLGAGESHADAVSAGFALAIPGVAELTVSTTAAIETRREAAQAARQACDEALRGFAVDSLADAESRLADRREARATVERLQAQRDAWLGGETLDSLRARRASLAAQIERAAAAIDDEDAGLDDVGLREALAAARDEEHAALDSRDRLDAELAERRDQINDLRVRAAGLAEQARGDRERAQRLEQASADARAETADEALAQQVDELERRLLVERETLDTQRRAYEAANPEQAELLAGNARAACVRHAAELDELKLQLRELDGQLAQARRENLFDALTAVEQEIAGLEDSVARTARQAAAARRLWEVLQRHRADASRRYVQPLKERIDALGRVVFNQSFAVDVADDLSISHRALDGVRVPFDSLSMGAQEQLGILARLAAAQLVGSAGNGPLLLDDTLGYADEGRLATMGAAIARVARDNQVIILTCMPARFTYVGEARTVTL